MKKIRYIDLFCGLGAFHAAFNTSKHFECVLACDIDEGVRKIYEANYGLKPHGDIRKLDIHSIPDFDISVRETLGMFGFSSDYNFAGSTDENSLFYLGNSIVVNVPLSFVPLVESYFGRA